MRAHDNPITPNIVYSVGVQWSGNTDVLHICHQTLRRRGDGRQGRDPGFLVSVFWTVIPLNVLSVRTSVSGGLDI